MKNTIRIDETQVNACRSWCCCCARRSRSSRRKRRADSASFSLRDSLFSLFITSNKSIENSTLKELISFIALLVLFSVFILFITITSSYLTSLTLLLFFFSSLLFASLLAAEVSRRSSCAACGAATSRCSRRSSRWCASALRSDSRAAPSAFDKELQKTSKHIKLIHLYNYITYL